LAYWPVLKANFINFDDPRYITQEARVGEGPTVENIRWAFTTPHPPENWQPVTTISYLFDTRVFGSNAFGHHLVNILVHLANSLLLLWLLIRLTQAFWQSALVATLFALHPINVEPVAWISSRKDVLCMLFLLSSIWFYSGYVNKTVGKKEYGKRWRRFHYGLALCCFVAALMSKAVAATLPFVLLLIDYWPLARMNVSGIDVRDCVKANWRLLWEKVPFFVVAAAFAWVGSYLLQKEGATANYGELGFGNRVANAVVSYARYLGKFVWPAHLSIFYPRPQNWPVWEIILSLLLMLGCTLAAAVFGRRRRYLFVGWFWFLGTLLPVIGIVHQLGGHAMADRYAYVAYPGLLIAAVYLAADILQAHKVGSVMVAGSVILLVVLFTLTRIQVKYWRDSESVFSHALTVDKDNAAAHNLLANTLSQQGRLKEAEEHYAEALRIRPDFGYAQVGYGVTLARDGKFEAGISQLQELLKKHPHDQEAYYNLAFILQQKGDIEAATEQYEKAIQLKADDADALNNLAWIRAANSKAALRNGEEAVRLAQRACEVTRYRRAVMIGTLAAAYAEAGRFTEAIAAAGKAQAVAYDLGQKDTAEKNGELLKLYRAGVAYHEPD